MKRAARLTVVVLSMALAACSTNQTWPGEVHINAMIGGKVLYLDPYGKRCMRPPQPEATSHDTRPRWKY